MSGGISWADESWYDFWEKLRPAPPNEEHELPSPYFVPSARQFSRGINCPSFFRAIDAMFDMRPPSGKSEKN